MSRDNLRSTLGAVEAALEHLATALNKGGFEAGSRSYTRMSEIVVGQRMWAIEYGIDEFDDRFQRVADLAMEVHRQLVPYVEAMDRLRMLPALVPLDRGVQPGSAEAKILDAINAASRPQSATRLRSVVGVSSTQMRKLLTAMVDRGLLVVFTAGSRTCYGAAQ
ncbi:hypothetical protein ACFVAV_17870 [Nocardia sp. NPDC057663]|uniref:hypothetical protein n=1 Tax=Nocardia sp. NPDC057663 TaxID=3346201 RepID=UPI00367214AB